MRRTLTMAMVAMALGAGPARSQTPTDVRLDISSGEGRRIRLDVRVNEAEHRGLVERAQQRGVSIARLLVDSALGVPELYVRPIIHSSAVGDLISVSPAGTAWLKVGPVSRYFCALVPALANKFDSHEARRDFVIVVSLPALAVGLVYVASAVYGYRRCAR